MILSLRTYPAFALRFYPFLLELPYSKVKEIFLLHLERQTNEIMINYSELSYYEKHLINNCFIPSIKPNLDYVDFLGFMRNYYFESHTPTYLYNQEYPKIEKKIRGFVIDNDFIMADARHTKLLKGELLRKAATIENYFEQITLSPPKKKETAINNSASHIFISLFKNLSKKSIVEQIVSMVIYGLISSILVYGIAKIYAHFK